MKKNFLYPVMALLMTLFAVSCSQEEIISNQKKRGIVSYAVNIPVANSVTRAVPNIPEGYTLRCILQLVDKDNANIANHRYVETLQTGQENVTFTFEAPESEYKCLFWADYVKTVAKGTEPADNLYTTTDLTAIGYNLQASAHADMFNTDAADAFYGALLDGSSSITLKRPFAKVSFSSSNAEYSGYNQIEISKFPAPSNFSVVSGSTTGIPATLSYTGNVVEGKWFSAYIFTSTSGSTMGEGNNIEFKLKDSTGAKPEKNLVIEGKNVPLTPNYDISADVTPGANNKTNITVTFPGDLVDPNAPQPLAVGDFIYKDGSYSKTYDAAKAVAIVFAIGAQGDDAIANYTGVTASKIAGYAMAISETTRATGYKTGETSATNTFPTGWTVNSNSTAPWEIDYKGMKYTKALMDKMGSYESALYTTAFNDFKSANSITAASNFSEWYIPSSRQLLDFFGYLLGCAGDNDKIPVIATNAALVTAYTSIPKGAYSINRDAIIFISSTISTVEGNALGLQITGPAAATTNLSDYAFGLMKDVKQYPMTGSAVIRPVLTIFEPAK